MSLINRELLIEDVHQMICHESCGVTDYCFEPCTIMDCIREAPSVESKQGRLRGVDYDNGQVVSVQVEDEDGEVQTFVRPKRGTWIEDGDDWLACSLCKKEVCFGTRKTLHYCPYCGANMR